MALVIGVSFSSCKPDEDQEETTKRLVKFTSGGFENTLKYDDQGHLIEYVNVMGLDSVVNTYTYTYVWKEDAIDITLDINGVAQEKCTLELENGLAFRISDNPLTFYSSFKYNSSDRLIECESFMGTRSLEWSDDKLMAKQDDFTVGTGSNTYTYEKNYTTNGYNPLIPYVITTDLLYVAHPELAGLATQKLFNRENSNDIIGDKEYTSSYKYEYEFDEDGYVNKVIVRHDVEDCEHIVSEYTMVWE